MSHMGKCHTQYVFPFQSWFFPPHTSCMSLRPLYYSPGMSPSDKRSTLSLCSQTLFPWCTGCNRTSATAAGAAFDPPSSRHTVPSWTLLHIFPARSTDKLVTVRCSMVGTFLLHRECKRSRYQRTPDLPRSESTMPTFCRSVPGKYLPSRSHKPGPEKRKSNQHRSHDMQYRRHRPRSDQSHMLHMPTYFQRSEIHLYTKSTSTTVCHSRPGMCGSDTEHKDCSR